MLMKKQCNSVVYYCVFNHCDIVAAQRNKIKDKEEDKKNTQYYLTYLLVVSPPF